MKRRQEVHQDREALLAELLARLYAGELSEGQLLRALRRDVLGITQADYARLVGVGRRTLTDMEGDKGNVSVTVMNRVFRPLGLRVGLLPRQAGLLEQALGSMASHAGSPPEGPGSGPSG